jgi:Uma2 family endonuclease
MADPAKKPATYQDVLDAPEHMVAQVIDGELHLQSRPASLHAFAATGLSGDLGNPFQRGRGGPGGWWILHEPELHLGRDILVPDLAGWRKRRLPHFPDQTYFELAPDWICEVHSPSTRRTDRMLKAPVYAREGVSWIWFVDPRDRTVEVWRLTEQAQWLVEGIWDGSQPARLPPFDAVELDPSAWFPPEAQPEPGADPAPDPDPDTGQTPTP